jgi:hypothetical protein
MRKELQAFDAMYQGKLNPRCTHYCETCRKYYSNKMEDEPTDGKPSITLIVDDDKITDCCHYNSREIDRLTYEEYMRQLDILKQN